jgi:hypothetical protein
MKLFTGWAVSAALVLVAGAAQAQLLAPSRTGSPSYIAVSDFGGPYAAMPPGPRPRYGYGPTLLPPTEVYTVVREAGFSPLGIPQQRGLVYTISVIDRSGDDGRLIIDARTGRIIRFMPAYRMGDDFNEDMTSTYGPVGPLLPVPQQMRVRGVPRPPASIPHVASRTVPVPKPNPQQALKPAAEPTQQSAAVEQKPPEAQTPPPAVAATVGQAKPPAPAIQPTQEMPKVQGLE